MRSTIALGMFGNPIRTTILEGALRGPNHITPIRAGGSCLFLDWDQFHMGFIWTKCKNISYNTKGFASPKVMQYSLPFP